MSLATVLVLALSAATPPSDAPALVQTAGVKRTARLVSVPMGLDTHAAADPWAGRARPAEVAGAAAAVAAADLLVLGAGTWFGMLEAQNTGTRSLLGVGGLVVLAPLALAGSPLLAATTARLLARDGNYAGSFTRAVLYAAGAHALTGFALVAFHLVSLTAWGPASPQRLVGFPLLMLARWAVMGVSASRGLHHVPAVTPPASADMELARAARRPPRLATSPTELALFNRGR